MEEIYKVQPVADCFSMLPRFIMEKNQDDKYELPPLAEGPWLIATHENQKSNKLEKQTFRTNTNSYIKTIPELDGNIMLVASQGWLILNDREDCNIYSIWNPVTSQFLRLPELSPAPDDINFSLCLLTESLDLDNNPETCKLVLFFDEGLVFSCRPTISHDCSWIKQSLELDGTSSVEINQACVFEGDIYGYAYGPIKNPVDIKRYVHKFVRINVTEDSSRPIKLEPMGIDFPDHKINFHEYGRWNRMVECCGVFYFIHMMYRDIDDDNTLDIIKVLVWRLDFSEMEWIRVESLSNRAFLLDSCSCTWCWAGSKLSSGGFIKENCTYIALSNDERVYSYNLEDDSYTSLLPHSTSLQYFSGPDWFMPSNHQRFLPGCERNQLIDKEIDNIHKINREFEFQEQIEDTQELSLSSGKLLSELPLDILHSIAKRLILSNYMNFRLTCKSVHQANPHQPQCRVNGQSQYPLLMIFKEFSKTYELLDPFDNVSRTIISTFNDSSEIISSFDDFKDGWLLLSSGHYQQYLNPFTKETGKYPPCELTFMRFGFSTCPTSPDCLTVGIFGCEDGARIACFDAAAGEWEYYNVENSDKDIEFKLNLKIGPKYHKNAFYSLGRDGCIAELKFVEGEISWEVYKYPFDEETTLNSSYLVEVDEELVSVFIGGYESWVEVFKFDTSSKCWLKLDTLGEHVLFVSPASSFSIKTDNSEMRNRIYLPRRKENEIIFYSLDTGKYHTSSGANSMDDFYGTRAQSFCCWVNISF